MQSIYLSAPFLALSDNAVDNASTGARSTRVRCTINVCRGRSASSLMVSAPLTWISGAFTGALAGTVHCVLSPFFLCFPVYYLHEKSRYVCSECLLCSIFRSALSTRSVTFPLLLTGVSFAGQYRVYFGRGQSGPLPPSFRRTLCAKVRAIQF